MQKLRVCLSQVNTTVGDIEGNARKIISKIEECTSLGADLIVFPELAVTGYPPEDLILKKKFIRDNIAAVRSIAKAARKAVVITGFAGMKNGKVCNSAAVLSAGKIAAAYDKIHLPNYGVFDEKRYFAEGGRPLLIDICGAVFAVTICEDLWVKDAQLLDLKGSFDGIINISASPYHKGKGSERRKLFAAQARLYSAGIFYLNLTGGQDELVFDGHSLILDSRGKVLAAGAQFAEQDLYFDVPLPGKKKAGTKNCLAIKHRLQHKGKAILNAKHRELSGAEEVYEALKAGVRDYTAKNGFKKTVVALSGGIDSALVSVIAADALGKENVTLIYMPSKFSSDESYRDALRLSNNIGIPLKVIPIQETVDSYIKILGPHFAGRQPDITEENLQARVRGNIAMAFSNKFGSMVLTTGNKSEMSTGYATLYGDMAGGFAVIKDVPKTLVYALSRFRNKQAGFALIPLNILKKAPTAELRHNQKDSDTLPEYPVLDAIIEDYVERDKTYAELKGKHETEALKKTIRMINMSEYKRRQAPPGIKITPKAFGRDRRMPITNRYREV